MLTAAVSAFQEQARAQKPTPPASPTPQPAQERLPSSPVCEVGAFIRFAHESLTPWRRPSQLSTPWMGSRPVLLGAPRAALLSAGGGGGAVGGRSLPRLTHRPSHPPAGPAVLS